MISRTRARRRCSIVCLVIVVTGLCAAAAVGTAAARDQTVTVWSEPEEIALEPGETAEIEIVAAFEGYDGHEVGVEATTLVAQYHPDYLSVTDIERGSWLDGDETDVQTAGAVDDENGTAVLEQRREPAGDGASGVGTIATLTVAVADDAPPATTELAFEASDVSLTSEWPTPVVDEPTTVEVDGGGESVQPAEFDHPDPDDLELEERDAANATDADVDGGEDEDGTSQSDATGPIDAVSGFSIAGTVAVGIVAAAVVAIRHRSAE